MSIRDEVELACDNADDGLCTVMDDYANVGVPVATLRAVLAKYQPAPVVTPTQQQMSAILCTAFGHKDHPHGCTETFNRALIVLDALRAANLTATE